LIREDFHRSAKAFEEALQQLASGIASGLLSERLAPVKLWKRAEANVTRLKDLAENCKELMLILKPERAVGIEQRFSVFSQSLTNFREILFQNSAEPLANSHLAIEQLHGAITDGSEFLLLVKEIRDNPSPLIDEVLRLREASDAGGRVVAIQATESVQPKLDRLAIDIETLHDALAALERAVSDVKECVRILQNDSIKYPPPVAETVGKKEIVHENTASKSQQRQKKQLSLSEFRN
jgi:hypothetical protein